MDHNYDGSQKTRGFRYITREVLLNILHPVGYIFPVGEYNPQRGEGWFTESIEC
jgi:hypothetical protein